MLSSRGTNHGGWPIQGGHPQRWPRRTRKGETIGLFNDWLGPTAQKWLDIKKLVLKEYTKEAVRHRDGLEIVEKIASKQFVHDGPYAAGSRKWIWTLSLSMPEYKTMIATAFNVLPVKSIVITWMRRGEIFCDNCREQKRTTVKHQFCICIYPLYEAIRTKRDGKVVCELYCSIKLQAKNDKLGILDFFQIRMAENTWGVPAGNALIFPDIQNDVQITSRRPDLIFSISPQRNEATTNWWFSATIKARYGRPRWRWITWVYFNNFIHMFTYICLFLIQCQ